MKLKDLFEMSPVHIDYTPSSEHWVKPKGFSTPRSQNAMKREYNFLTKVELDGGDVISFYQHKRTRSIIAGFDAPRPEDDELAFYTVMWLEFKKEITLVNIPSDIHAERIMQVNKVHIGDDWRGKDLALFAYAYLAYKGFYVLSDEEQYTGGKMLWKSMARKAHLHDYQINIINVLSGYLEDADGNPIQYDSKKHR